MVYPALYVLRHGQTTWNVERRFQGSLDSPLTVLGQQQARDQNRILRGANLAGYRALCSPQGRAIHTADVALHGLIPKIETDVRLREIGVGKWEGLSRKEISPNTEPDDSEESVLHLYDRAPGGEGLAALRERCVDFLSDLRTPTVLITHGVTSRMLRLVVLGMDTSDISDLPGGQGVVFHLEDGRQRKLTIGLEASAEFV